MVGWVTGNGSCMHYVLVLIQIWSLQRCSYAILPGGGLLGNRTNLGGGMQSVGLLNMFLLIIIPTIPVVEGRAEVEHRFIF